MSHKVIVLDVAKPDFRETRAYVKDRFGDNVWNQVNQEFKDALEWIGKTPDKGKQIEELLDVGVTNFRIKMVRQTRIVYEFNSTEVLVHMFIHTSRDFKTHLMKRLFNI